MSTILRSVVAGQTLQYYQGPESLLGLILELGFSIQGRERIGRYVLDFKAPRDAFHHPLQRSHHIIAYLQSYRDIMIIEPSSILFQRGSLPLRLRSIMSYLLLNSLLPTHW